MSADPRLSILVNARSSAAWRGTVPLLAVLSLLGLPCSAIAQGGHAVSPQAGRLKITVPAVNRYWIYLDATMVSSPPSEATRTWTPMRTPQGYELYVKGAGLIAEVDDSGKIIRVNSKLARAHGFYRSLDLSLPPGTHTVQLLRTSSSNLEFAFPFVITSKRVDIHAGQVTEYSPELRYEPPAAAFSAPEAEGLECPYDSPPDTAEIRAALLWYSNLSVVRALHEAAPSYASGPMTVVRLDLPVELGGSLEFDDSQIRMIVDVLKELVDQRIPPSDVISHDQKMCPAFAQSLSAYRELRDHLDNDINSFGALAHNAH